MKGPLRRLDYSYEHLRAVAREVGRFMASDPYAFRREIDPQSGDHIWRAEIRATPPDDFSLLVGDCVHNLRASLDNLAWSLACTESKKPPGKLAFPICWKRTDDEWKFRALPKAVRGVIREAQPYHRPEADRPGHPLIILNELWNRDKHRAPAIVGGISLGSRIHVIEVSGSGGFSDHVRNGPFDQGDEIARFVVPQGPDAKVNIEGEFAVSVAFEKKGPGRGWPVLEGLEMLHHFVREQVFARVDAAL